MHILPILRKLSRSINRQPVKYSYQLSVISYQLSVISYQLSDVSFQFTDYCLLFTGRLRRAFGNTEKSFPLKLINGE